MKMNENIKNIVQQDNTESNKEVTKNLDPSIFQEELIDKDDLFYFESDHLALKGNRDYHSLLKTVAILEAQRAQAIKDLDELLLARNNALKNPIGFVSKLQNGELPEYPLPQEVAEIPSIDWSKYNISNPDFRRPLTRNTNQPNTATPKPPQPADDDNDKILVRGRIFDESKPETFNQLWTVEEQKRLEELLIQYPPEEIEMRRWTKIAKALGNRTPKQVSSRVQKYFIKLAKTGLPIPGRGPKSKNEVRKTTSKFRNNIIHKKSTFFPSQDLSFLHESRKDNIKMEISDEFKIESISSAEDDSLARQIEIIKEIKCDKNNFESYHNLGYKCFVCGDEPLMGTRWHCTECFDEVDLCGDCVIAQIEAEDPIHPPHHKLIDIRPPNYSKVHDSDYLPQNFSNAAYNYLDPNFLPE